MSAHPLHGKRHRGHDRVHRTEAELALAFIEHQISRPALCAAYHSLRHATLRWVRNEGSECRHPLLTPAKEEADRLLREESDTHSRALKEARHLGLIQPHDEWGPRCNGRRSPVIDTAFEIGHQFHEDHGAQLAWLELAGHSARWGVRFERTDTTLNGWAFLVVHLREIPRPLRSHCLELAVERNAQRVASRDRSVAR